jgi:hypothetical protein
MKILAQEMNAFQMGPKTQNDLFIENISNGFYINSIIYDNHRYKYVGDIFRKTALGALGSQCEMLIFSKRRLNPY